MTAGCGPPALGVHLDLTSRRVLELSIASRANQLARGWDRLSICTVLYIGDSTQAMPVSTGKRLPERLRLLVLVVGRQHYFEDVQDYPLSSLKELRRVLRFENPPRPIRGPVVRRIERLSEQSFRVTRWLLNGNALPPLESVPTLLVPETALLPQDRAVYRFPHDQGELVHFNGPEGLRSGLLSDGEDEERFLEAMGGASAPVANLRNGSPRTSALQDALIAGLRYMPLQDLPGYFHYESSKRAPFPWARATTLASVLLASYLALTSLGLMLHHGYLNFQLDRQANAIEEALAVQRELRAAERRVAERASLMGAGAPGWTLWPVVVDLIQEGTQLTALRFEAGEVTLFGTAPRATDLLEAAGRHPMSEDARFIQPVRQRDNRESFALRFRPKPLDTGSDPDA